MPTFKQMVMKEKAKAVAQIDNVRRNVIRGFNKILGGSRTGTFVGATMVKAAAKSRAMRRGTSKKINWPNVIRQMPGRRFNVAQVAKVVRKSNRDVSTMLGRMAKRNQIKRTGKLGLGTFARIR